MSRVYAPLGLAMFDQICAGEETTVSRAFTVTPELRESLGGLDEEELEHLATQLAAASCADEPRGVVALEITPSRIERASDVLAGCQVKGVRMKDVVCFFTSDDEFDEDADIELSWYDASEISAVHEALNPR